MTGHLDIIICGGKVIDDAERVGRIVSQVNTLFDVPVVVFTKDAETGEWVMLVDDGTLGDDDLPSGYTVEDESLILHVLNTITLPADQRPESESIIAVIEP